jgi:carboxylesterase type B
MLTIKKSQLLISMIIITFKDVTPYSMVDTNYQNKWCHIPVATRKPQIPHIYSQMTGDRHFVVAAEQAARLQAAVNSAPVYFYQFGYRGKHSLSELMSRTNINFGMMLHNSHSVQLLRIRFC